MVLRSQFLFAILSFLLFVANAGAGSCEIWNEGPFSDGLPQNGYGDELRLVTTWDPDGAGPKPRLLVVAGDFSQQGSTSGIIDGIAAYDAVTNSWWRITYGTYATYALTEYNNQLIAGGSWTQINNVSNANHIAAFSDDGYWEPLGNGTDSYVYGLGVHNGELVVGGSIYPSSSQHDLVKRWTSGSGWQSYPSPDGGYVYDVTTYNSELVVCGLLTSGVQHWNGSSWQPFGPALDDVFVESMAVFGSELVAGGLFHNIGGTDAEHVARWTGSGWVPIGAGTDAEVNCVAAFNGQIIVGGNFTHAGGIAANHIARWSAATGWQTMGAGMDGPVLGLTVFNNQLVAVGDFTTAGGLAANNIATWNTATWSPIVTGASPKEIKAFATVNNQVIAAGDIPTKNYITRYDGVLTFPVGGGMNDVVNALTSFVRNDGDTELVAGGFFTTAGPVFANRVARWIQSPDVGAPQPQWQAMGNGFNGGVNAVARFNFKTIAGGFFTASADSATALSRIAMWNETTGAWQAMGSGMNGSISALRGYSPSASHYRLVAAGYFTNAGGVPANYVAGWNETDAIIPPPSWGAMGPGFDDACLALEYYNGSIYAGGAFMASGIQPVHHIARFNGSVWVPVGNGIGFDGNVTALRTINGFLYAGGQFSNVDGIAVNNLARFNGTSWEDVDGGTNDLVEALIGLQNQVHVGGTFTAVENGSLTTKGWAKYLTNSPWIAYQPSGATVSCLSEFSPQAYPADGYIGLSYQWRKDRAPLNDGPTGTGSEITGSDSSNLSVLNVTHADEGVYDCVISTNCGSATSHGAALVVDGPCTTCVADIVASATFQPPPDGVVDGADLAYLLGQWGTNRGSLADLVTNSTFQPPPDGLVDGADLAVLLGAWGACD